MKLTLYSPVSAIFIKSYISDFKGFELSFKVYVGVYQTCADYCWIYLCTATMFKVTFKRRTTNLFYLFL